jgi:NAD(P)-dependent dehydrogenase (short-subunit alcohol dehydrogenase family)
MNELNNKVALVTGASGALGNFVTEAFLAAGATVIGVARSIQPSAFADPKFVAMAVDLSKGEATKEMGEAAIQRFEKIDMLVHVMGGFAGGELIDDTDDATWDKMMNLNLRSAFNICRAVLPHMRKAKRGRVIAIGARSAVEPKAYLSAYCASKAALVSLIRTVALEGKDDGIAANVILPGTMDTPANRTDSPSADFSKWVPPVKVASLALWLASEEASQISGALIPVYGAGL